MPHFRISSDPARHLFTSQPLNFANLPPPPLSEWNTSTTESTKALSSESPGRNTENRESRRGGGEYGYGGGYIYSWLYTSGRGARVLDDPVSRACGVDCGDVGVAALAVLGLPTASASAEIVSTEGSVFVFFSLFPALDIVVCSCSLNFNHTVDIKSHSIFKMRLRTFLAVPVPSPLPFVLLSS